VQKVPQKMGFAYKPSLHLTAEAYM